MKMFICDLCNKKFTYKSKLHEHKNRTRSCIHVKNIYHCLVCDMEFKFKSHKMQHLTTNGCIKNHNKLNIKKGKNIIDNNKKENGEIIADEVTELKAKNDELKNKLNKTESENSELKFKYEESESKIGEYESKFSEIIKNNKIKYVYINKNILLLCEYIYIATTFTLSLDNTFKIGRTNNIKTRLIGYNTGRISNDKYYYCYVYKCCNAVILEKLIFNFLKNFKVHNSNEMYQLHLTTLNDIVKYICDNNISIVDKINDIISNKLEDIQKLAPVDTRNMYQEN